MHFTRQRAPGFTLVELVIALTILGILAALGLPAFADMIKDRRRATTVQELTAAMFLAHGEALKRGQPVIVCGVNDANDNGVLDASERTCAGTDWSDGWMVAPWSDADNDSRLDAGELQAPVRSYVSVYEQVVVTASALSALPGGGALAMQPFNRAGSSGRLTVCDDRGARRARGLEVATTGRARLLVNNVEDTRTGVALACP